MTKRSSHSRGKIKRVIAGVAPRLAQALGGPLAGAAVPQISKAVFGDDAVSEDDLGAAIETLSPEQRAALKKADHDFALAARTLALEEERIAAGDRASARGRQAQMDDWTPSVLGALIIGGFFLTLAVMVARRLPEGAETEFSIMLGALATMTAAVVNYFFGSSAGSKEKTRLMSAQSLHDKSAALEPRE